MQHRPIESAHISSVGYDLINKILEVKFRGGGVYEYRGVPPQKHAGILSCPSPGQYLEHEIKPHHSCERIK